MLHIASWMYVNARVPAFERQRRCQIPASRTCTRTIVMNRAAVNVLPPSQFNTWPAWLRRVLRRDSSGIEPQWEGSWLLASGGGGTASLWVTYDEANKVSGRMVVKSMVMSHRDWWDPTLWSDGLNAVGYRDFAAPINHNHPQEAIITQRLTQNVGPPIAPQTKNPICQYLGYSAIDQQNRRWKLYLEFCPFGTLDGLHLELFQTGRQTFPEPFVWYVAEQALLAAKIFEQGDTAAGVPGWRPLVHRDIKPANVLLGERDTTQFRHYPRLKFCDFGLVCETDENDIVSNPIEFNEVGTVGYRPPEQKLWYKKNGKMDFNRRLSQKTNVWAIGRLCWALKSGIRGFNAEEPDYNIINDRVPLTLGGGEPELRDFILACLAFDPAQRPTIDEALALVRSPVTGRDNFLGMRTAPVAIHLSRDPNPDKLDPYPRDEHDPYRLKLARGSLPPRR
ncbi:uncharacterized protein RCC_07787 [Ramularia collo-cygni]|uniref:non-specific serine/threonine protein kinase n=1 Tax=Ramularia collo-cygni TaxID=112498 RepID=A0A2D3V900_9PEZI|nr:uncharacterized protein RCC_07787 [Ramularia collo-cygni]CZT21920.1 uncharacterized protein RCC_07787 [Ramularia collo-cygni]